MSVLILGLVVFLGIHSVGIFAPAWRDRMAAQMGEIPWKAIYAVVSLVGLLLIIWGYGATRDAPVPLWAPPVWLRHVNLLLMVPVFALLLAAYLPGRIRTTVKHPMLAAVKLWAFGHLLANGNLADVVLFGSFLVWAVADRISFKRRVPPAVPLAPEGKLNDLIAIVGGLLIYGAFMGGLHLWLFGVSPLGGG
jgi:uncharacterized membrane protein